MAAIDKLKTDFWDFDYFRCWVIAYHPRLLSNLYAPFAPWPEKTPLTEKIPIANFTHRQDLLLLWRCPLPFVREYLEKQCGLKTRWYHRLFWTRL